MKVEKLKQFLLESNRAGYASGNENRQIKEPDGSTTIIFEKGDWKSHDNYFGGEPYGGRTVVFYRDKPVWMMVYYGWVEPDAETEVVYRVLRNALMQMPEKYPFRGPETYAEGKYVYANGRMGEIERFSGEEEIRREAKVVYKANYLGGLVNQR